METNNNVLNMPEMTQEEMEKIIQQQIEQQEKQMEEQRKKVTEEIQKGIEDGTIKNFHDTTIHVLKSMFDYNPNDTYRRNSILGILQQLSEKTNAQELKQSMTSMDLVKILDEGSKISEDDILSFFEEAFSQGCINTVFSVLEELLQFNQVSFTIIEEAVYLTLVHTEADSEGNRMVKVCLFDKEDNEKEPTVIKDAKSFLHGFLVVFLYQSLLQLFISTDALAKIKEKDYLGKLIEALDVEMLTK